MVLKNKLSLIINSVSFSMTKAPLKNSSLDAKNGLNVALVNVFAPFLESLSYINFEFLSNALSISTRLSKSAIFISFLISMTLGL